MVHGILAFGAIAIITLFQIITLIVVSLLLKRDFRKIFISRAFTIAALIFWIPKFNSGESTELMLFDLVLFVVGSVLGVLTLEKSNGEEIINDSNKKEHEEVIPPEAIVFLNVLIIFIAYIFTYRTIVFTD